jgi:hypothetical protein
MDSTDHSWDRRELVEVRNSTASGGGVESVDVMKCFLGAGK